MRVRGGVTRRAGFDMETDGRDRSVGAGVRVIVGLRVGATWPGGEGEGGR